MLGSSLLRYSPISLAIVGEKFIDVGIHLDHICTTTRIYRALHG